MGPEAILVAAVYFCSGTNSYTDQPGEGCVLWENKASKSGFGNVETSPETESKGGAGQGKGSAGGTAQAPAKPTVQLNLQFKAPAKSPASQQRCRDYFEYLRLNNKVRGGGGATTEEVNRYNELSRLFLTPPTC